MDAYEIKSQDIVAHWWRKHTLPELIKRAEVARQLQLEAMARLQKVKYNLDQLEEDNRTWQQRIERWLAQYGLL